mgnify:FL=1
MKDLKWKAILIVVLVLLALWQLHYSWVYFKLTPERIASIPKDVYRKIHSRALHLGLDLKGGMHIVLQVERGKLSDEEFRGAVDRALEIIRNRVDQFGVSEPIIQRQGEDKILVQLPGVVDRERAREIIGKTALLEFKLVAEADELNKTLQCIEENFKKEKGDTFYFLSYFVPIGPDLYVRDDFYKDVDSLLKLEPATACIPAGYQFLWGKKIYHEGIAYRPVYLVKEEPLLTGDAVLDAVPGVGTRDNPMGVRVDLTMTREARGKWAVITGANIGRRIAIVLDGVVYSAPVVRERIPSGRSQITLGNATMEDAKTLAVVLKAGALPAPLKIVEERSVGPSLGADSIRAGIRALLLGTILVFVFMVVYYTKAGVLADLALILNLIFLLAILSAFRATLTLPGLAGIILTVGMAVDANVLIFERLREELKAGKTIRTAISTAYSKAFTTIFDANLTTFIAAIILYWFGTGPIKGFAVTLSIGLIASFFTALFVTRVIFDAWAAKGLKSVPMLGFIHNPNINFIGNRRKAFIFSIALIIISIGSLIAHKGPEYGIDFTGGYLMEVLFKESVKADELRGILIKAGFEGATIQGYKGINGFLIKVKGEEAGVGEKLKETLHNAFKDIEITREEFVGPAVSKGLQVRAMWVVMLGMIGILIYVAIRFTFRFAVGAVVALLHDVIITIGALSIAGKEFTIPIIAALLTIVGYSVNDSIVVSDRIRENMKLLRKEDFETVVNRSINETLSRTIITSLTTLFVVLALFFLGGRIIHDFAYALLVGIVIGTYSSIFVVAPLVVEWERKSPTRRRR